MSIIQFGCPHCGGAFEIDESAGGQQIECPSCSRELIVPQGPSVSAPPPPPPGPPSPSMDPLGASPPPPPSALCSPASPEVPADSEGPPPPPPITSQSANLPPSAPTGINTPPPPPSQISPTALAPDVLPPQSSAPFESDASPGIPSGSQPITGGRPKSAPIPVSPGGSASGAPTPQLGDKVSPVGGSGTLGLTLREPVAKTIKTKHGGKRELRRLSPEEKASRRFRRNLIMMTAGILLLTGAMALLNLFGRQ